MTTYLVASNTSRPMIEINKFNGALEKSTNVIVEEIRSKLAKTFATIPELYKIDWIDEVEELGNGYVTYKRIFTNNIPV